VNTADIPFNVRTVRVRRFVLMEKGKIYASPVAEPIYASINELNIIAPSVTVVASANTTNVEAVA